jgi:hypothetical protein
MREWRPKTITAADFFGPFPRYTQDGQYWESHQLMLFGYTERFPGITGYLFLSEDLRKYRPAPNVKKPSGGFFNHNGGNFGFSAMIQGYPNRGAGYGSDDESR